MSPICVTIPNLVALDQGLLVSVAGADPGGSLGSDEPPASPSDVTK